MKKTHIAVIPAAGLGIRMLPATAAVPKELLPVGGRPALDWILEEVASAGIEQVIVVSSRRKPAIERYLSEISRGGYLQLPVSSPALSPELPVRKMGITVIYQEEPLGLGDAVHCAQVACPGESLAVLLPDELLLGSPILLPAMLEHHERSGRSIVSLMEVPLEEISRYGCAEIDGTGLHHTRLVKSCVEKPDPTSAPSNYALCGRYVLGPEALALLEHVGSDYRGEIQLTSALDGAARRGELLGVEVLPEDGRIDVGSWSGWLSANRSIFETAEVKSQAESAALPRQDRLVAVSQLVT